MATNPVGTKVLFAGVALGLVTTALLYVYLRKVNEHPRAHWQRVVVAQTQIPSHAKITPAMVTITTMPPELIVPDALREVKGIEGKVARHAIQPHEQILKSDLMTENEIPSLAQHVPEGKRAIAIAANEVTAVGSVIKPGDRVDILATYRDPTAKEETTQMILQNVPVLAVNRGQTDPATAEGAKTSMTLAVAPEETERLTAADRAGVLRVSLRSPTDTTVIKSPGVTVKDISGIQVRVEPPPPPPTTPAPLTPTPKPGPMPVIITTTNVPEKETVKEITIFRGIDARPVRP